jgi:hypothetical protein
MHSTLRTLVPALILTAAAAFATKPALADARVQVPFDFTVNGKQMPAGQYLIKTDKTNNTVTLVSRRSSKVYTWIVVPSNKDPDSSRVVLKFNSSDAGHSLRTIQFGNDVTTRLDQSPSRTEDLSGASYGGR